jgi:hypothetical protein
VLPESKTCCSVGVEEGKVFIKSAPLILHVPAALYPANPIMLLTSDSAGKVLSVYEDLEIDCLFLLSSFKIKLI